MICLYCGTAFPQSVGKERLYCSEACRKNNYARLPCVDCGAPTAFGSRKHPKGDPRCDRCGRRKGNETKRQRRLEIERRWQNGETLPQIARSLGTTINAIGTTLAQMRKDPRYNVPHRHPWMAKWCQEHPEHMEHVRAKKVF